MLGDDLEYKIPSESDPLLHPAVSTECFTQSPPPILIRFLAQIMTGLHFIESVGATFILWLCPSLAPEPRLHQYVSSTPGGHHHSHCRHHEHRRHSHNSHTSSNSKDPNFKPNPRRRSSRMRSASGDSYVDCFVGQPDTPKLAEQRKEILAIFEQHKVQEVHYAEGD